GRQRVVTEVLRADENRVGVDDVAEHDGTVAERASELNLGGAVAAQPHHSVLTVVVGRYVGRLVEGVLMIRAERAPFELDAAAGAGNGPRAREDVSVGRSRDLVFRVPLHRAERSARLQLVREQLAG